MAIYDMSDFSNTKKWLKNKNRQVSLFVMYIRYCQRMCRKKRTITLPFIIELFPFVHFCVHLKKT